MKQSSTSYPAIAFLRSKKPVPPDAMSGQVVRERSERQSTSCTQRMKGPVRILARILPPLPGWLMDLYVYWKVGSTGPAEPEVDYAVWRGRTMPTAPCRMKLDQLPERPHGFLRLVIISDTHERHRQVRLPTGDILLHCGDILMSSSLTRQHRGVRILEDFNAWLQHLPFEEKVVIGGNHDTSLKRLLDESRDVLPAATIVQDRCVELPRSLLRVYGNSYSEGTSHNRAWQMGAPKVSDSCANAHVVITHAMTASMHQAVEAVGAKPLIWAYGHDHGRHGIKETEGTLHVNAAVLDGGYQPTLPPVVVDLHASDL